MATPDIEDLDSTVGFSRKLPGNETLAGTTGFYNQHLFVCSGLASASWPGSFDKESPSEVLSEVLSGLKKAAKSGKIENAYINVTDEPSVKPEEGLDVLLFTTEKAFRFHGINADNLKRLVKDLSKNDPAKFKSSYEKLETDWIFVCAHQKKDARCGYCGPILVNNFKTVIENCGLTNVKVSSTTHVGGHKYAGNVLAFPSGNWYGNVCPSDVAEIVEKQIMKSERVLRLWRGQMGLSKEEIKEIAGKVPPAVCCPTHNDEPADPSPMTASTYLGEQEGAPAASSSGAPAPAVSSSCTGPSCCRAMELILTNPMFYVWLAAGLGLAYYRYRKQSK